MMISPNIVPGTWFHILRYDTVFFYRSDHCQNGLSRPRPSTADAKNNLETPCVESRHIPPTHALHTERGNTAAG